MEDVKYWKTADWWKTIGKGAAIGAIVVMIIGFGFGGWVTGGTAQQAADNAADQAVIEHLVPICVEQYKQDPNREEKLQALKDKVYSKGEYVSEQGWATMPGGKEKESDYQVANQCAEAILKLPQ